MKNPGFGILNPVVRFFFKLLVKPMRKKDFVAAQRVDAFVTISGYTKELIAKYYKREATVVHPPVEVESFQRDAALRQKMCCSVGAPSSAPSSAAPSSSRSIHAENFPNYYITTSRQVNWKRLDLVVKACVKLKRELLVVGEGPEHARLVKMASGCDFVKFLPLQNREELAKLLVGAKGYIFPSLEPFGIAPVEALAAGCPVIAFGEGGVLDYIRDGKNGVLFEKQTVSALVEAVEKFEKIKFDSGVISRSAEKFSVKRFDKEMREFVDEKVV